MPLEDSKERCAATFERLRQTGVEDHFRAAQPSDKPPPLSPYTDELFKEAAIQWLVETDQVSDDGLKSMLYSSDRSVACPSI